VASQTRLSHRDYHHVIGVVAEAAAADGAQPFEFPVIERLLRLVPADHAGYFEFTGGGYDTGSGNTFFVHDPWGDTHEIDWRSDAARATTHTWPLMDNRVSASSSPLKLSDFLTRAELPRNPFYNEVLRPRGLEFQMKVWLPAPPEVVRGFFFERESGRRDLDERDRAVLALLRPHLASIRERWERRHRPPLLTARETEVLELVANGLTNGEVASQLVLSPTTVRTHLENIFEKLDVHNRTAAAARLNALRRSP
jgi:DNA-binding CsgD family transcriptional regulator